MKLVYARRAVRRLAEIADFIRARNPAAAGNVERVIRDTIARLECYPSAGRSVQPGVGVLAVPKLPYSMYDNITEAEQIVTVITIRHTAQKRLPS
ncbi:type II toxin-antitoxin system RelE/ParE family toxin [Methylobacterium sp. J-030]|uniref:type II toxin-antitoxin system RelE/ParE family toxin n=1 Tax=Methylobacterium sp. J-030 TaxID=2836627 RepID=UPI001FB89F78|nr:type II toxin-antitoxin system RelE/ParE family toxin [Methylobacterium sp. J-030]MCJ2071992.1 type II toxin-antitoxin system RelE/ParE family toxin [Methylobacterium sp. J-030]